MGEGQNSAGFGTAPVVVEKGRVYTFGLFKPGTKPEDIPLAPSTPTLEEVRAGSTMDGQPLSTRQLPDSPSWEEDHRPACRCDEYAFCLDAATGKPLWASRLTDWGIAYQANTCWGSMTLHRGAVWFIRSAVSRRVVPLPAGCHWRLVRQCSGGTGRKRPVAPGT